MFYRWYGFIDNLGGSNTIPAKLFYKSVLE